MARGQDSKEASGVELASKSLQAGISPRHRVEGRRVARVVSAKTAESSSSDTDMDYWHKEIMHDDGSNMTADDETVVDTDSNDENDEPKYLAVG